MTTTMSVQKESIEWVEIADIVLGTNARTIKPSKERVNEYARSIAMYGILVPLIERVTPTTCKRATRASRPWSS